jgi:hypothetical protein
MNTSFYNFNTLAITNAKRTSVGLAQTQLPLHEPLSIPSLIVPNPLASSMPHQIPDFQISHFLTLNTVPTPLSSLSHASPRDRECPICHNAYADPPTGYVHPDIGDGESEYAVQVQNRGSCAHIFGRRCIEAHIRSGNPWSHTCPLCRAEWFPAPSGGRGVVLGEIEGALSRLARVNVQDEGVRSELEAVDRALVRMREVLRRRRWI